MALQHHVGSGCSLTVAGWQTADKSAVHMFVHNEHCLYALPLLCNHLLVLIARA